ncbi:transporter [Aquimarina agarivorans]|uniref:transporter n=1 Tax=Aquimarina agarivorans TaxID=980584 RepID=UPI001EE6430A|nr:transporter [Aquimarina agarivorans]
MQKINIMLFLCFTYNVFACDICNSSATNTSSSHLGSNSNYIGLVYNHLDYQYKENIVLNNSPIGYDFINPVQLIGNYNIQKKINLTLAFPYLITVRETSVGERLIEDGVGDVSFMGTYNLFNTSEVHALHVGAGVKMPTGDFSIERFNQGNNQTSSNQLGTGSWDVFFPVIYSLLVEKFKFKMRGTYYIKGENDDGYRFGNQLSLQSTVSYPFINKKSKWIGSVSNLYDTFKSFERFGIEEPETDGFIVTGQLDLQCQLKSFTLGANYRFPIEQKLVEGNLEFNNGFGLYTFYQF